MPFTQSIMPFCLRMGTAPNLKERKTRAYKEDIGKYSNMTYAVFEDEHYYICHDGRELHHIRTESKEQDGYTQTKHYRSQRI